MNTRLTLFVAISLLAHASLLLVAAPRETQQLTIGGYPRVLQVSLQTGPAMQQAVATPEPAPSVRPQPVRPTRIARVPPVVKTPRRPGTEKAVHRSPLPPAQEPAVLTAVTTPDEHPTEPAPSQQISAALRQQLARHFSYPGIARKRGWQGKVTLSLRVETNGTLSQVTVEQSSGYPVLDRSALHSALRIGQLPGIASQLHGKSLQLQIPVHFRLLDS